MFNFDPVAGLIRLIALLPALTLHEFCHAYSAVRAGDPTPKAYGRLTLNPLAHLDPIGTLMILFAPIGWAKPVPINPANFRHPSRDIVRTSAVGPLSNVVQGIFWALVLRALLSSLPGLIVTHQRATLLGGMLAFMALLNFVLAVFNLIPLGPLDGHHILQYTLPYEAALGYKRFNDRYGMAVLIGLILLPWVTGLNVLGLLLLPATRMASLVAGVDLLVYSAGIL